MKQPTAKSVIRLCLATVLSVSGEGAEFLCGDGRIYRTEEKRFLPTGLGTGGLVWVHFTDPGQSVVNVMPYAGESVEEIQGV